MPVGYTSINLRPAWAKVSLVAATLVILPCSIKLEQLQGNGLNHVTQAASTQKTQTNPDPRIVRLRSFFSSRHSPILDLAEEFIQAADDNQLDWRLLPSISVIESGGGKAYKNNNIFGWGVGLQPFSSLRSGLRIVAFKLGNSPLYRNQNSEGKLKIYNPDADYAKKVVGVMKRISPVVKLQTVYQTSRIVAPAGTIAD